MKNKFTNNLGLKIGSVLFAAVLWLLVTNINDPSVSRRLSNIPVKIVNADVITSQGKIYEVLEDTDMVGYVNVLAPRSVMDTINQDNIVAVADMNDLTNLNTIAIKFSSNKYNEKIDSITGSIDSVKLNIENLRENTFVLEASTSGKLEDGYIIGDVTTEQNQVRVSGPESVMSRISKAKVNVPVTGFTSDIKTDAEIRFYDAEGTEIGKDRLDTNIDSVLVYVEILAAKEVPIRYGVSGTPASGYRANGVIDSIPETVLLAGRSSVVKNVSAFEVPDTALDVTGLSENLETVIDLKEYLPGNLEFGNPAFDGKTSVIVHIEPEVTRNIVVSEADITIKNMPEGFRGTVSAYEEEFTIQVTGLAADVDDINADQIFGTLDITKLLANGDLEEVAEGNYYVPLSFNLPENVSLKEKITVGLVIEKKDQT